MSERLEVRIITPERVVYSHLADSVLLPGYLGEMEILPGHVALLSGIRPGTVRIRDGADECVFASGVGLVEVCGEKVILLVDSAQGNLDIDPKAAQALIDEAEDKLKNLENEDAETRFAFEAQLATAKARIEVFKNTGGEHEASRGFSMTASPAVSKDPTPEDSPKS